MFPSPAMEKTAAFYQSIGFIAVPYLEAKEPHICLYKDRIEIVLTQSNQEFVFEDIDRRWIAVGKSSKTY